MHSFRHISGGGEERFLVIRQRGEKREGEWGIKKSSPAAAV